MPCKYWLFAFQTTIFIINWLPFVVLSQNSPYGVLYNCLPDYTSLRSFGCLCFPYICPYAFHKMTNKYVVCCFLGYSAKHKGFLCLDMAFSRMYASYHIVFDETRFPFLTRSLSFQLVSPSNSSSTLRDSSILSIPTQSSRNLNNPQPNISSSITVPIDFVPISTLSDFLLVPSNPSFSPTLPQSFSPTSNANPSLLPNRTIVTCSQNGIFKSKKIFNLVVQTTAHEPSSFKAAILQMVFLNPKKYSTLLSKLLLMNPLLSKNPCCIMTGKLL